ncbi:hypothetical protein [Azoarcus sp. DN11]|uniref:hypothetical protein n=1 Tax=Azoarcus sp. DN11 TaxID=356837 RepID=UPI000EB0CDF9|nr:hypothetical protein [Azoarcus sp. DN11]AYH42718.1 hypothetical protein CDA09_04855 [Azoarcus sp. DN11]
MCATLYTLRGVVSGDFVCMSPDGMPFLMFGDVMKPDTFCEHAAADVAALAERFYGERFERVPVEA